MRIQELICESFNDKEFEDILQTLKRDCNFYFSHNTAREHLFRGINGHELDFDKMRVRKDREPMNMDIDSHKQLIDLMIKKKLKAHRGNSIFVSSDLSQAREYGTLFYIFPIGEFSFSWNPHIKDLYYYLTDPPSRDEIEEAVDGYTDKNFRDAIKSGYEIMINCDYFYILRFRSLTSAQEDAIYDLVN